MTNTVLVQFDSSEGGWKPEGENIMDFSIIYQIILRMSDSVSVVWEVSEGICLGSNFSFAVR